LIYVQLQTKPYLLLFKIKSGVAFMFAGLTLECSSFFHVWFVSFERFFKFLSFFKSEFILISGLCFGLFLGQPSRVKTGPILRLCLVWFWRVIWFKGVFDKHLLSLFCVIFTSKKKLFLLAKYGLTNNT